MDLFREEQALRDGAADEKTRRIEELEERLREVSKEADNNQAAAQNAMCEICL